MVAEMTERWGMNLPQLSMMLANFLRIFGEIMTVQKSCRLFENSTGQILFPMEVSIICRMILKK